MKTQGKISLFALVTLRFHRLSIATKEKMSWPELKLVNQQSLLSPLRTHPRLGLALVGAAALMLSPGTSTQERPPGPALTSLAAIGPLVTPAVLVGLQKTCRRWLRHAVSGARSVARTGGSADRTATTMAVAEVEAVALVAASVTVPVEAQVARPLGVAILAALGAIKVAAAEASVRV
jgi:hypothetical protein